MEEHNRIVAREQNPERRAFYQLAWLLGALQSDLADLRAEDVDWPNRVISFFRVKTRWRNQQPPQIRFGKEVEAIYPISQTVDCCSLPSRKCVREIERRIQAVARCLCGRKQFHDRDWRSSHFLTMPGGGTGGGCDTLLPLIKPKTSLATRPDKLGHQSLSLS